MDQYLVLRKMIPDGKIVTDLFLVRSHVLGFWSLYTFGLIGKSEIESFQQNESEFIAHQLWI